MIINKAAEDSLFFKATMRVNRALCEKQVFEGIINVILSEHIL